MIGEIVAGKYRIESLIGSGGMANVYKAISLSGHRVVAIKVVKDEYKDDEEFLRRFKREAQAVLSLSHDNIVKLYDVGEQDGYSYIVLEYVAGPTLKQMIKRDGPLPPRQAVNLVCQLLDALSHAHEYGIIHRDVKPQNVIVTARGRAKLTDFGIARDVEANTLTFSGANVLGSVHYISPEQAKGEAVTQESDIYSVGITLYEMLTGKVPFDGDNTVAVALKHLQEDFIPPIVVRPSLSLALNDIVLKATCKDPAKRYHSARDMKRDLQRALREPNERFAQLMPETKETIKKREARPKRRRVMSGILKIGLFCLLALGLFAAMFIMVRSIWERENSSKATLIPKLTDKTVEEAEQTAALRGYSITIGKWTYTSGAAEGVVIEQTPAAGSEVEPGSVITLTVSSGSISCAVPDLSMVRLSEASLELGQAGLVLGEVAYEIDDTVPAGYICRQEPAAETELFEGDPVNVWVSGTPSQNIEMPVLTQQFLSDALTVIKEQGFKRVLLRPEQPYDDAVENTILKQIPAAGMFTDQNQTVELWVCNLVPGVFTADIAFNVDIAENDTPVMVTMIIEDGLELVLYESFASEGKQVPIAFQTVTHYGGEHDTVVYVNGVEAKRGVVNYEYRG